MEIASLWIPTEIPQDKEIDEVIPPGDILHIQIVVVNLLDYALAVDNTMLVSLGDLGVAQKKGTEKYLRR